MRRFCVLTAVRRPRSDLRAQLVELLGLAGEQAERGLVRNVVQAGKDVVAQHAHQHEGFDERAVQHAPDHDAQDHRADDHHRRRVRIHKERRQLRGRVRGQLRELRRQRLKRGGEPAQYDDGPLRRPFRKGRSRARP